MTEPEIIGPRRKIRIEFPPTEAIGLDDGAWKQTLLCEVCGGGTAPIGHRNFRWTDALAGTFEIAGSKVDVCYHCVTHTPAGYRLGISFRDEKFIHTARSLAARLTKEAAHA